MSSPEAVLPPSQVETPAPAPGFLSQETRDIIVNGLWTQNPGIVQLLGLCPLLAISNNIVNALSLGLATTLVMAVASGSVALVRNFIPHEIRIPAFDQICHIRFVLASKTVIPDHSEGDLITLCVDG